MRIVYFSKYSTIGPSSRYRIYQYLPYFNQAGIDVSIFPLFGPAYFRILFLHSKILSFVLRLIYVIPCFITRLIHVFRAKYYDMVIIEHQLFPYLPITFEKLIFYFNKKVILEMDDAIYLTHSHKIPPFIRRCTHVIVGNKYLSNFVHKYNDKVTIIPTVIDMERFKNASPRIKYRSCNNIDELSHERKNLIIGWVGLPYNFRYVKMLEEVLNDISSKYPVSLRVISSKPISMRGISTEFRKWSLETEVDELYKLDIGIMPLSDDEWSRGKCGLKLLQYMAAGLPVVASPVGVNSEIVQDGKNGFLAWDEVDWYKKLSLLCENQQLRESLGQEGRKTVEERYSLSIWGPRLVDTYMKLNRE